MDSKIADGLRVVLLKVQEYQKGKNIEDIAAKMLVLYSEFF